MILSRGEGPPFRIFGGVFNTKLTPLKLQFCHRFHNRSNLKRAKSKYIGPRNTLTKEQVVDCAEGNFLVQSETSEEVWYSVNMKSGFCTCPVGVNCAPCKHKNSVSTLFSIAEFSVAPDNDPCQRALYHYIAMGFTLPPHMYR